MIDRVINFSAFSIDLYEAKVPKHLMAFCLSLTVGWKVVGKHIVILNQFSADFKLVCGFVMVDCREPKDIWTAF